MHDLTPLCALGSTAPRIVQIGGVTLSENAGYALASVTARSGQEAPCATQMTSLLGVVCPDANGMVQADPFSAFWIGPEQWMVAAPFDSHETLATHLTERFGDVACITEQSDAWVIFDMQGDGIEAIIQLCANIDIETMPTGAALRSVIHYMGVYILRNAPDSVTLLGGRSFAGSLHHALVTAMRSAL